MSGIVYANYELVERPGETETMTVFKGQHVLIAERFRAVKMPQSGSSRIKAAFKADRLKELFEQVCHVAARLAAALDSATPAERASSERIGFIENIHFDGKVDPDPENPDYIITEWVGGGSLTDKLSGGAMPLCECVALVAGILEGLEFAHAREVTHGNLKPSNILLNADGQPKIVDFGGNILGEGVPPRLSSLPYLSPEQLDMSAEVDGRADLFSLTLLFYEMLTGRRAPRLLSPAQMPSRLNPQCPPAFDEIILQGLQNEPRARLRSAREMRERVLDAQESPDRALTGWRTAEQNASASDTPITHAAEDRRLVMPATQSGVGEERAFPTPQPAFQVQEPEPLSEAVPVPQAPTRRAGERRVNDMDGAELIWVPGGVLQMGTDVREEEKPVHSVQVSGFWMYKYPITQQQYLKFIQYLREVRGEGNVPPRPSMFKRGDMHSSKAAAGIGWSEAQEYARWAGARLPTEAEWEWAASGPENRLYPWGDIWDETRTNVKETGLYEQSDVDRYPMGESWCGALDLIGNVFEWCSSLYKPYPYDAMDGREDQRQAGPRCLRGGAANTPAEMVHNTFRCPPSAQTTLTGFRLAKSDE